MMHAMQVCTLQALPIQCSLRNFSKQRCAASCDAEHHGVLAALLVTAFHILKTESIIKAECPPERSPDGKQESNRGR